MTTIRLASARLVARLARRLARRPFGRRISLPLAAPARALTQHIVHRHTRFGDVIQSRLTQVRYQHLALVSGAVTAPVSPPAPAAPQRRPATPVPSGPLRLPLAQRLARRVARVEAAPRAIAPADPLVARHSAATAARSETGARSIAAMPVLHRDRRPGRHEDVAAPVAAGDRHTPSERRHGPATAAGHAAPDSARIALPDGEIERLAGRVIDSIDRRIAAQRERVGRF